MTRIGAMIVLSVLASNAVNGLQHGRVQIGGSASPEGYYCDTVTFPSSFTGSDPIKVFTSLSMESNSSRVHDVGFLWTESVTTSGFRVCVLESGIGFGGDARVNWAAYQVTESSVAEGSTRLNDWTTGTKCKTVLLSMAFPSKPKVFVTVRHNVLNKRQDAAAAWVEDIARDEFTICLREARTFDGRHKDIEVVWMAFAHAPLSLGGGEIITQQFPNSKPPKEKDNNAYCKTVKFANRYVFPPTIVLTPSHVYKCSDEDAVRSNYNSIVAWNEEITRTYFRSCVKDLVGLNRNKHHPITVDYMVISDPDPCIQKTCDYFATCKPVSPGVADCVCKFKCPKEKVLVCASNGQTFDNLCIMKREICRTKESFTYFGPGPCKVDLRFPRRSITDYVITKTLPALKAMTYCFWMKTNDTRNKGTPFGYDIKGDNKDELQAYDYRDFELVIDTSDESANASANDGQWHQICATWRNTDGSWAFYKDGKCTAHGEGLKTGYVIPGGGAFIVGQEQDVEGDDFDIVQSFVGDLTELNIWNKVLGPSEIFQMSRACQSGEGNVLSWSDVLSGTFKGQVQTIRPSSCK